MDGEHVRITKLKNSENWPAWKFQVRIILNSNNAWNVTNGTTLKPKAPNEKDATKLLEHNIKLEEWMKADNVAQKVIATTITDQQLLHIINCGSAKEMWDKLLSVHEQKSDASVHMLQQQWYSITKNPVDDITTHISKLEDLAHRLRNMGEEIPNSLIMTKILMTLPTQYNHFVSAWDSTNANERTLPNLTARLAIEEMRINSQTNLEGNAFAAKQHHTPINHQNNAGSKQNQRHGNMGRCYNCNKPGHYARNCRSKNKVQNKSQDKAHSNALMSKTLTSVTTFDADGTEWFLDSGASDHMSNQREWFVNYIEFDPQLPVRMGNGEIIFSHGKGDINVMAFNGDKWVERYLADVLYVPNIKYNLFSVGAALDKGLQLESNDKNCKLLREGNIVAVGERQKKLYKMKFQVMTATSELEANIAEMESIRTWHEKLAHQNLLHVRSFLKKENINFEDQEDICCDACILGKMHRHPFQKSETKSSEVGELIHADVCGPMQERSIGGSLYFLLLKDDLSHWKQVYFLKQKSEVAECLEDFLNKTKKHLDKGIKVLRTDNGLEFINQHVKTLTRRYGVIHQRTVGYSPQQNGAAERENRTVVEAARTLLQAKGLPTKLWAEAVHTVVHILNRTGTSREKNMTPHKLWVGKNANVTELKIFGQEVYSHVPKEKRRKWDPKAEKGFFVGYDDQVKGCRIWFPADDRISICRDVKFTNRFYDSDDVMNRIDDCQTQLDTSSPEVPPVVTEIGSDVQDGATLKNADDASVKINKEVDVQDQIENLSSIDEAPPARDYPEYGLRNRTSLKRPTKFGDMVDLSAHVSECIEPVTYDEALSGEDKIEWKRAMDDEIESLIQNHTWDLIILPRGESIIDNKWTFKIKRHPNGSVERYKARLVARGFKQQYGVNYFETFSPVVRFDSLRVILSIAASKGMKLQQFDIKTAFLYGELQEDIYMQQPIGYDDGTGRICKLKRSLYGLKQASRCWNQRFTDVLQKFSLTATKADPCVFSNNQEDCQLILAIYIDDGLISSTDSNLAETLLKELKKEFNITSSIAKYFLGLEIEQLVDGSIFLHQEAYAKKVVERFNMTNANPVAVPADRHHQMCSNMHPNGDDNLSNAPYREAVGSLMYLSTGTRPDITFAVNRAGQFLEKPKKIHWNAVKRILKYLKGTLRYGLLFNRQEKLELKAFSDADYAGDVDTRKSTSGFVIKMGSSIVSWSSQKQSVVALSTTESEYIAATQAVKEIIWLKNLLQPLLNNINLTSILYMDNQSAIRLIKNPEFHKRTKHIDVKFHFIKEKYELGDFTLEYVPSESQQADIMTKPLSKAVFQHQCKMLQVIDIQHQIHSIED